MILVEWKDEYDIGVPEIDFQHRYFVKLINRLATDLSETKDIKLYRSLLDELNAYAAFHFVSEENMMNRAAYPSLERHRRHHKELLAELSKRQIEIDIEDMSKDSVNKMLSLLVEWFLSHTTIEDKEFAAFLNEA